MIQKSQPYLYAGFFPIVLFSSCATILNSPLQKVSIITANNTKVISVEKAVFADTLLGNRDEPVNYYIARRNEPLRVILKTDSLQKTVLIKSAHSLAYWANIVTSYGIGMLVDKKSEKRFAYPKRYYFSIKDGSVIRKRFPPLKKGTLNLSLSLPFITSFDTKAIDKRYRSTGIAGLETGVDYVYRNNRYMSVGIGAATDRFGEYFGTGYLESASALYGSVRNNNVVGSFDVGYGINLSQLRWARQTMGDTVNRDGSVRNTELGLSVSAQYRLGKYVRFGVLYQPDILAFHSGLSSCYQHYLSLNLNWKFPVGKAVR